MSKMTPEEAARLVQEEFKKLQEQMQAEVQKAIADSKEQFNPRVVVTLIDYADQLSERLSLHAALHESISGNPAKDDEDLVKAYKDFRNTLPI